MISIAGQTMLDLAIQMNGTVFSVVDLALGNLKNVTDDIQPKSIIQEVVTDYSDNDIRNYFLNNQRKIATGYTPKFEVLENYEFPQGELPISL